MTDIRTLHRSADLELADEGGIAPLPDDEYLREPKRRQWDWGAAFGVFLLVAAALSVMAVLVAVGAQVVGWFE